MRLSNKVALITGAAAGIGLATAQLFVENGAKLVLTDIDEKQLQQSAKAFPKDSVEVCHLDVTNSASNAEVVAKAVSRFGRLDIFVANAGIEGQVGQIIDSDVDILKRVFDVNVAGVWLGLQSVVPVMQKQGGGSIVITSSAAGLMGSPNSAAYNVSKHAVVGLMRCAAREYAEDNIRVNTVNPGPVDTRMMRSLEEGFAPGAAADYKAGLEQAVPMQRYGTPQEVADLILFLSSNESSYINGAVHMIDGGLTA